MTTVPMPGPLGLPGLMQTLHELGFTIETLDRLNDFLAHSSDSLGDVPSRVRDLDEGAYGANLPGTQLGYHSRRARAHVLEAVQEMATGLLQYREAIQGMKLQTAEADDTTVAALQSQLARASRHFPSTQPGNGTSAPGGTGSAGSADAGSGEGGA